MKVLIAIDSFKGSISSYQAGVAAELGVKRAIIDAETIISPLADGGEGTVSAITPSLGGELVTVSVTGPLGDKINAVYGVIKSSKTAIIEMSAAAGITLIDEELKNPLNTTTFGVGEIIKHAITENGCRKFIIGIGGSATNDGGVGMLQALGFSFKDKNGREIERAGKGLANLADIDNSKAIIELKDCEFFIACDVTNPLCGLNGCSYVYGPQKGATDKIVKDMDLWLNNYADLTFKTIGKDFKDYQGAGAAGGLGFAFLAYLNGKLESGIDLVIRLTELEDKIKVADIVVTGEGKLDGQTRMGKAPIGVSKIAKKYNKPVIAFAGAVASDAKLLNECGIDAFFPIVQSPCSLSDAMDVENAKNNLSKTVEQAFRLIATFINK